MGLLAFSKKKWQAKLEREADRWKAPKTENGQNISSAEGLYMVAIFVIAILLVGIAPKNSFVQLLIFGAAVVAMSAQVKKTAVPAVYNLMAAKLGWPSFVEASQLEAKARQAAEAPAATPEPAQAVQVPLATPEAPAPGLDDYARKVLSAFLSLPKDDRRQRALAVAEKLKERGLPLRIEDGEDLEERQILTERALRQFGAQQGLAPQGSPV